MLKVRFIPHGQLSTELLKEIIQVKSAAWPYSYSEHCDWMNSNLNSQDIHVLLYKDHAAIAYLNLVHIIIQADSKKYSGFGIGNVCAIKKGEGYGKIIITEVNRYLVEQKRVGLLFCKDTLVKFYTSCEWKIVPPQQVVISAIGYEVYTLVFNSPEIYSELKYEGRIF